MKEAEVYDDTPFGGADPESNKWSVRITGLTKAQAESIANQINNVWLFKVET